MKISFLIPTNRQPQSEFVQKSIENINNLPLDGAEREILVFSPFEVSGPNVTWYEEKTNSDGCVAGYNFLINQCAGKYAVHAVDDCFFDDKFIHAINLLESYIYARRGLKILTLGSDNGLGSFMPQGYPKYSVLRYPIVALETAMTLMNGYFYHPEFKNHYADNWLGYWITRQFDETIIEYWDTTIHIGPPTSYNHNNDHDFAIFRKLVANYEAGYTKKYVD